MVESDFFSNPIYLSYSGLSRLMYSPAAFYKHYVLNQREDTDTPASIEGSLVHCLLLEPNKFEEKYLICNVKFPSDNLKKVIDSIFFYKTQNLDTRLLLEDYQEEIFENLRTFDLYQKMSDSVKLGKVLTEENKIYFAYLNMAIGKVVITQEMYDDAQKAVDAIHNNEKVSHYLGLTGREVYSELGLQTEGDMKGFNFGLHGFLDRLYISHDERIIYICDFKKTSKTLYEFPESIEYYKYWIQAIVYLYLVADFIKKYPDVLDYEMQFRFIVIDKYSQVGCFKPSDATLKKWQQGVGILLDKAEYYITNRDFTPIEFLNDYII